MYTIIQFMMFKNRERNVENLVAHSTPMRRVVGSWRVSHDAQSWDTWHSILDLGKV